MNEIYVDVLINFGVFGVCCDVYELNLVICFLIRFDCYILKVYVY